MAKRALVIGAKVPPLRGPEHDAAMMQAMLAGRGFEVDVRIADNATRAGILAGYDRLIAASQPGDTAVIYYSGHGCYGQVLREGSRSWQAIVPVDYPDSTACDWRGITAWELSIKQAELTARTRNVTVILDACTASQMSRRELPAPEPGVETRTLPHPVAGFAAHLALLRERYGAAFEAVDPVSNRDAVRLVACGQGETAFEIPVTSDRTHGVFTTALVEILTELGEVEVSWFALAAAVRARVRRRRPTQFPAIEGPARRRVFSLVEEDEAGRLALDSVAGRLRLAGGVVTGVALDDAYGIMPVGATAYDASAALGTVQVDEVHALTSFAVRRVEGPAFPPDAVAFPITRTAVRCVDGRGLRELEGEHGVAASEVALELGVVTAGARGALPSQGATLGVGDCIYLDVDSRSSRPLYVHVFAVGVTSAVRLLTPHARCGVRLDPGRSYTLGRCPQRGLRGITLGWPAGVPADAPRLDELFVIVTTAPTSLHSLETPLCLASARAPDPAVRDTHAELAELRDGPRIGAAERDGYYATRVSWQLDPRGVR